MFLADLKPKSNQIRGPNLNWKHFSGLLFTYTVYKAKIIWIVCSGVIMFSSLVPLSILRFACLILDLCYMEPTWLHITPCWFQQLEQYKTISTILVLTDPPWFKGALPVSNQFFLYFRIKLLSYHTHQFELLNIW